ncbi:MAG: FlgD immunoglobulin-like domain containing protein [Nitrososphaera sp.]
MVLGLTFCLLFGAVTLQPVLGQQSGGDDDDDEPNAPNSLPELILNEALTLGDIILPEIPPAAAQQGSAIGDLIGIVDEVLPGSSSTSRTISDGISLSDSMIWQADPAEIPEVNISDALSVGDNLSSSPQVATNTVRGVADSMNLSDSLQNTVVRGNVNPNPQPPAPAPVTPAPTPVDRYPPPRANVARFLIETLEVNDAPDKGSTVTTARPESNLRIVDNIAVSGLVVPPSEPIISITSPPLIELSQDGIAEITFHSTSTGTYGVEILDKDGKTVRSLEGEMKLGANSVSWDGRGSSDAMSPAGRYIYYISAAGAGGSREPPRDGDGVIVMTGPQGAGPLSGPQVDPTYLIIVAIIGAAGAGLFLFLRRQKSLVMYLPASASEVIDDMREKYPDLVVEDYVDPNDPTLFKGVTIKNPKGADEQWLTEMAEKAKNIAGVDSVSINYRGKQQTL